MLFANDLSLSLCFPLVDCRVRPLPAFAARAHYMIALPVCNRWEVGEHSLEEVRAIPLSYRQDRNTRTHTNVQVSRTSNHLTAHHRTGVIFFSREATKSTTNRSQSPRIPYAIFVHLLSLSPSSRSPHNLGARPSYTLLLRCFFFLLRSVCVCVF